MQSNPIDDFNRPSRRHTGFSSFVEPVRMARRCFRAHVAEVGPRAAVVRLRLDCSVVRKDALLVSLQASF